MFRNYLKTAIRVLMKNKVFSLINILGLVISLAAFLILFLYVAFETSYDTFHENADFIYRIRNDRIYEDIHDKSAGCPPALGPTLKKEFPEVLESARLYGSSFVDNLVSYTPGSDSFQTASTTAQDTVAFNENKLFYAEASFLKMFSFPMVKGTESALDEIDTAVISISSARKYFGDKEPIGEIIAVTNSYGKQLYRITGVFKDIPANSHVKFDFLLSYDSLIRLNSDAEYYWGWNAFNTYLLLSPDAHPQELEGKLPQIVEKYKNYSEDYRREYLLQPLKKIHLYSNLRFEPEVNGNVATVRFLIVIAIFIMLIGWTNYINLSASKSMMRAKEVGIRKALGSQRLQLIKQFISESFLFNVLAVSISVVFAEVLLPYFSQFSGKPLTFVLLGNIWFWLVLSVVAGAFLSGVYPAFVLSSFNPVEVLTRKSTRSAKGINLKKGLVIFQFALSIALIVSTLVVFRQLSFMLSQNLGFNLEQTLVLRVPRLSSESRGLAKRFREELLAYPSVKNIAISTAVPGKEYSYAASSVRPLDSNPEEGKRCFFINVDDKYFDLFGIKFAAGRNFSQKFSTESDTVILNEEAVRIFGYKNPEHALNQKIRFGGLNGAIRETVGVIKNYHHKSLRSNIQPIIFSFSERGYFYSIKIDGLNTGRIISIIQAKWKEVLPGQPFEYFFLDESFNIQYRADQQFGKVLGLFTVLAVFVSCLGLFGLALFISEQRTKEIGIRKVLGASVSGIVFLLSKDITKWVLLANTIALPVAYFAMKNWLQNYAYRIGVSWWMLLLAGALALAISLITVSYHAVKTALADPVDSLRYE